MMHAVIYCRVSTERQARENDSLPYQRKACIEYCQRQGWEVVEVFMEAGESAKTADRTQLKRMMDYCSDNKGRVHVAVVHSLSRFSRETLDHKTLRLFLRKLGVTLRSVTEPIDDTPEGEYMEHMISGMAQYENRQRARRTVAGMKNKIEKGGWPFRAPLGYRNIITATAQKTIEPDPERRERIRTAFEMYSTGVHTKEHVLRQATSLGLRTLTGQKVSGQTFDRMLRNPLYAGHVGVRGWEVSVAGTHEAIVSKEVFDRVQAVLAGKVLSINPRNRHNPDFPLRHFVRCGNCNRPLTASWVKGRRNRYPFYNCQNRYCNEKVSVRKDKFEGAFFEFLRRLQPKTEYASLFRTVVTDVWQAKQGECCELSKAAQGRVAALKEKKRKLMEARFYDQSIGNDDYLEMKHRNDADLALAEIEEREAQGNELDVEAVISLAETIFLDAARLWSEMSSEQKQRFQQVLFPSGVQFSGGAYRTTTTCLLFNGLEAEQFGKEQLVALTGIEPVF
jgi:site-specific DNA recombinase